MNTIRWSLAACSLAAVTSWGAVELVSVRDPAIPPSSTASGESSVPIYSGDGRFLVFSSAAPNLTTNAHQGLNLDVYLRELASGKITLVSVATDGGSGGDNDSVGFGVSRDGRSVVFQSRASNLVAGDTNGATDIFVRDVPAGVTTLVSAGLQGQAANGESSNPSITPDGRYVFFESRAPDLVADDTNGQVDVFRRDLQQGTTLLLTTGADGESAKGGASSFAGASDDGQRVAFRSAASNVAATALSGKLTDLYFRDLAGGNTTRIAVEKPEGNLVFPYAQFLPAFNATLSGNGRYLAFQAGRVKLTSGNFPGVYWFDLEAGTNVLASDGLLSGNALLADDLSGPAMSADGRTIAFEAEYGVSPDNYTTVYVWNADQGRSDLTNPFIDAFVPPPSAYAPVLSADGKSLALVSDTLAEGGEAQLFHHPLQVQFPADFRFDLVNVQPDGKPGGGMGFPVEQYSPDASKLAFISDSSALVADDYNRLTDTFVRDLAGKTTTLVSARDASMPSITGNGYSSMAGISADGRFVVFTSLASNLVPDDHNGAQDVFVRDLVAGKTLLVSANPGGAPGDGSSSSPVISADGRFVAFSSIATDLVPGDANAHEDVFLRDLAAGTTTALSVTPDGSSTGNGDSTAPLINQDGTVVAFQGTAGNLAPGTVNVMNAFVRDVQAGTTVLASAAVKPTDRNYGTRVASLSADGSMLGLLAGPQSSPYVFERLTGVTQWLTNASPAGTSQLLLSADGNFAVFDQRNRGLVRRQLRGGSAEVVWQNPTSSPPAGISADGRYLLAEVPNPNKVTTQVALFDAGPPPETVTASASVLNGLPSQGDSDTAAASADGQLVVFRSNSPELWPGLASGERHVFARDLVTGAVTLLSRAAGTSTGANGPSSRSGVSADGRRAAFNSFASDLVAGDFNAFGDVFAAALPAHGDSDGDGMDDLVEQFLFGNLDQTGGIDFDGDGASNATELGAGTSPLFPASLLRVSIEPAEGSDVLLSWPTVLNRRYFLESRAGLGGNWQSEPDGLIGNGQTLTNPAIVGDEAQTYFRVSVR